MIFFNFIFIQILIEQASSTVGSDLVCTVFLFSKMFLREGGVQARRSENSLDNDFFSPQLILQFTEGVQWFYYRDNYTFPRIQRGSNIFQ